jgi:hypothetical protein
LFSAPLLPDPRFLVHDGVITAASSFYDFHAKVTALTQHFAAHGLTLPD